MLFPNGKLFSFEAEICLQIAHDLPLPRKNGKSEFLCVLWASVWPWESDCSFVSDQALLHLIVRILPLLGEELQK